jgi:murein DD-endopeptidase MepM/ murein hydrolase activator NlpD
MSSKRRTLVLIRHGERELGELRVSRKRLALAGSAFAALLALAGLVGSSVLANRRDRGELDRLRAENLTLRQAGAAFESRLRELQERLGESEDRTRQLAIVAGLGNLGPSPESGVGGELHGTAAAAAALAVLEQRTQALDQSLESVASRIEENLSMLSATPSLWPVTGMLSSGFGWRRDPLTGQRAFHSGLDITAAPGRPVASTASGVVVKTLQYGGLGRAVYVAHGFGRTTVYGHLSRILVTPGQRVERGETLGLVGSTGRSTGYHLHYEVQVDGGAVNPLPFLLAEPGANS